MTKKNEIKKVESKNQEVSKYDFIICPNCGAEEVGKFCPNCGQSNKDFNKPIKEVFSELLDSINFDLRLLNTLIPFFAKPGFLAQEYFKGKRMKYVPPIRMYMIVSIIFFFLAQGTDLEDFKNIGTVSDDNVADSTKHELASAINSGDSSLVVFNNLIQNGNDSKKDSINESRDVKETKTDFLDGITYVDNDSTNKSFGSLSAEDIDELKTTIESDSTYSKREKRTLIGGLSIIEKIDLFGRNF